jgi:deoxyribonuclease-4
MDHSRHQDIPSPPGRARPEQFRPTIRELRRLSLIFSGMFGSHLSIAGGMHHALLDAERYGMETVQVFTKNQQQWAARPLDPAAIRDFREQAQRLGFGHIVAHDSYLINLAAKDDPLWEKSIAAFSHEMERCDQLAIPYLVTHPGAHCGSGESRGIDRVIEAMLRILRSDKDGKVTVCLETTAGQGTSLGFRFEQIAAMLQGIDAADGGAHRHRVAVCVDTCHILAAGYDITTAAGTRSVLDELDRLVGLSRVKAWHLNDSKKPRGSRVDRHEHIGRGSVGLEAFGVICRDPRFHKVPKIMETPKEEAPDGRNWDEVNLELLRGLAEGRAMRVKQFRGRKKSKSTSEVKPGKIKPHGSHARKK